MPALVARLGTSAVIQAGAKDDNESEPSNWPSAVSSAADVAFEPVSFDELWPTGDEESSDGVNGGGQVRAYAKKRFFEK